jgi:hypothetical protein
MGPLARAHPSLSRIDLAIMDCLSMIAGLSPRRLQQQAFPAQSMLIDVAPISFIERARWRNMARNPQLVAYTEIKLRKLRRPT